MAHIDLDNMSRKELENLQKDIEKALKDHDDRRVKEARAALEAKAKELGFSLNELVDGKATSTRTVNPAKYRHPENPARTWTGRGRQPSWIKDALENGMSLDDFLIDPKS